MAKGAEGGGGEGGGYSGLPESAVRVLQDLESEGGLAPNRKPKVDGECLCGCLCGFSIAGVFVVVAAPLQHHAIFVCMCVCVCVCVCV